MFTLPAAHACLVLSARRRGDSPLITNLTFVSVLAASVDALVAALAVAGMLGRVSSDEVRLLALLNIAMLLSTALPPLLRRAGQPRKSETAEPRSLAPRDEDRSADLLEIARRLDRLVPDAGEVAAQIEREASRLREVVSREPMGRRQVGFERPV